MNEKISKQEVAQWIRKLIPYLENPMYLAPKGCFKGDQTAKEGKIIEYDAALMPNMPKSISQSENIKELISLYALAED